MTIAIHQPNYLPWLGYFYKIYASDVFVFHDVVEFSKASYTKRCRIRKEKHSAEVTWLSVPVKRHSTGTAISQIQLSDDHSWMRKHLHKIENTYGAAEFFEENFEWLSHALAYNGSVQTLAGSNIRLIRALAEKLSSATRFYKSSELQASGTGTELNLNIALQLGATTYLAGTGSLNYQDDDAFTARGIQTITHDFGKWLMTHSYNQETNVFTGGLSIVDALMHLGTEGILKLFREFDNSGV